MGDMGTNKVQTTAKKVETYETDLKKKVDVTRTALLPVADLKDEYIQPSEKNPINLAAASAHKNSLQETCIYYEAGSQRFLQDRQCLMRRGDTTTTMNLNRATSTAKVGIFGKVLDVLGAKVSVGVEAMTMKDDCGGNSVIVPSAIFQ